MFHDLVAVERCRSSNSLHVTRQQGVLSFDGVVLDVVDDQDKPAPGGENEEGPGQRC
jgi:hypothetical protein